MDISTLIERAIRRKMRFPTNKGGITLEDLWDLPLTSRDGFDLDSTAKAVNAKLKAAQDESFVVTKPNAARAEFEAQLEIVKYVIATRIAEDEAKEARAGRAAEKKRLLEILDKKQEEAMLGMSKKQIEARIAALSDD